MILVSAPLNHLELSGAETRLLGIVFIGNHLKDRCAIYQSLRENKIDAFADDGELLSIVKMFDRRISTRKLRVQY